MAKPTLTRREKVQAVARLEAGESVQSVARDVGCTRKALSLWRDKLVSARPDLFPNLAGPENTGEMAEEAAEIAQRIKGKIELRAERLLDQLERAIPHEARVDKLAVAFGILSDKLQVMQGKPTSITAESYAVPEDATPAQLEAAVAEIDARMKREPVSTPQEELVNGS